MTTNFKVLESLLDSWKTKNIDTEMFYDSVKNLVLRDYLSERRAAFEDYSEDYSHSPERRAAFNLSRRSAFEDYLSENTHLNSRSGDSVSLERTRPVVSGVLLKELENWVDKNLILKESAVGELTKDLFNDYGIYLKNLNISEKISRKSFPHSLYFYLKTSKGVKFVKYTSGRNSMFTGLELKSQKRPETA